ncbi:RAP protein, putative [Plasmodium ovale wallikeri]|uniref:RAP protein, putative n=2 Tax=Plasmodium ovale TaxID=36330 RepID=A0A1A8YMK2_PLAOA|nr:RAP protein, putative [Plasmodium ovale wallikeri]SBT33260.1 RAP protein, putative [Plasmodium ovale wallikeri]SBT76078.1 RAP protein, putative [Plasmodium ovale]
MKVERLLGTFERMIAKVVKGIPRRNFICFVSRFISSDYTFLKDSIKENRSNVDDIHFGVTNEGEMHKDKLIYLVKNIQMINLKEKTILNNISNLLKKYMNEFSVEEIYLIIHTFCKLNFTKYSLYNNFVKIIMNKKPLINTRTLTQLLIDLHKSSSLDMNALTFFTQYYIKNSLKKFSLFDLSMLLYIFNKYNYNDMVTVGGICDVIQGYFMPVVSEDKGVLTTILLSLSVLNANYDLYSHLVKEHVYKNYEHFEVKYLCNIAYSIVLWLANGLQKDDSLSGALDDVVSLLLRNTHKLKNEELKQLHIVLYFLRALGDNCDDAINKIEKKNIKNTITVSKIQQQIERVFKEMGLHAQRELPVGPYMLDFALKKKRVCIEVNGFTHYYTFGGKLNSKTKLKYFILRKLQWKVITIEYMDWKNKSKDDKLKYIEAHILEKIR